MRSSFKWALTHRKSKLVIFLILLITKTTYDHRLTFWLSNAIVLRAIISESPGEHQLPPGTVTGKNGIENQSKIPSPLKWQSLHSKSVKSNLHESSYDWDDPCTFQNALEKVEAWIFSRIIESIWWQVLIHTCNFSKLLNLNVTFDP